MATMHVAFLLNCVQPADQDLDVISKIARECYIPLSEIFASDLNPRFSLSITRVLLRHLEQTGQDRDIFPLLKKAMGEDKLEIVHSGAYHPIFPLLPEREVERQIELDFDYKSRKLGLKSRTGVYSPELCYRDSLVGLYRRLGFAWTIMDDNLMSSVNIPVSQREIYQIDGFSVFLRSALWSNRIMGGDWKGHQFIDRLDDEMSDATEDRYLILSLAGETFGHHIPYYHQTFLLDMLHALGNSERVNLCRVSDLLELNTLDRISKKKETDKGFDYFPSSSAATGYQNYQRGDPYSFWCSTGNPIHKAQWQLTELILGATRGIDFSNGQHTELRKLLDRAFYSQQYYWASIVNWRQDMKYIVYEGIDYQMRALYKAVRITDNQTLLARGTELYARLMREIHHKGIEVE